MQTLRATSIGTNSLALKLAAAFERYGMDVFTLVFAEELMSASVQVFWTPASRNHPRAQTTGVREAPRHEIAGRKGLDFVDAIYGDVYAKMASAYDAPL